MTFAYNKRTKRIEHYEPGKGFEGTGVNMKAAFIVIGLIIWGIQIGGCIRSEYNYEKNYSSYWELADKSSTIDAKAKYITDFVKAIEDNKDDFSSNNAIFLKTANNQFDNNLKALISLRDRLLEINKMDPSSFQYNTAIQQITEQEQGEAGALLYTLKGCYVLSHYWYTWDWLGGLIIFIGALFVVIPCIIIASENGF